MNIIKERTKFLRNVYKSTNKILNKTSLEQYFNTIQNEEFTIDSRNKDVSIKIISDKRYKEIKRKEIVDTLIASEYIKTSKKWTDHITIGFLSEMYRYNQDKDLRTDERNDKILTEISNRYNVPKNRLNSTVALFLNTYKKGKGGVDIGKYFTDYELILWQYNDPDKLNKAIEENKLTTKELAIIHELFDI